uniref:ARAD1D26686p n=1 Tax=Blastobotrys adeninivorans TaxID=409370 RepID=A0A060TGX9_BLAAD
MLLWPWLWIAAWGLLAGATTNTNGVQDEVITSIVDILSRSAQYSKLLHYLRALDLITLLNLSRNATLLAPINSAFAGVDPDSITRDLLLYHILEGTLLVDRDLCDSCQVVSPSYLDRDGVLPVLISRDDKGTPVVNNSSTIVEYDLIASPGRGVVHAIDSILELPKQVEDAVHPFSHIFSSIISLEQLGEGRSGPLTVLAPSDTAFDKYSSVQVDYLLHAHSDLAKADRQRLIERHTISDIVLPQHLTTRGAHFKTQDNSPVNISAGAVINGSRVPLASNIVAVNGLVHVYDNLLEPTGSPSSPFSDIVSFTPEKLLLGMHADSFVQELNFLGLSHLIDGSTTDQTIFVPQASISTSDDDMDTYSAFMASRYHFVDGSINLTEAVAMGDDYLLTTKMRSPKLGHRPQRLKCFRSASGDIYINGNEVIGPQIVLGDTSIYVIEGDLDMPPSLELALGPFISSSFTLRALRDLHLLRPPKGESWTILLPSSDFWSSQGLVVKYLESNTTALRAVLQSLIFETPIYSDSQPTNVSLLNGQEASVNVVDRGYESGVSLTVNETTYEVDTPDILFDAGVAHSIDRVDLASTGIDIQVEDLLVAGDRSRFLQILRDTNVLQSLNSQNAYTLLVPSDEALEKHSIDSHTKDIHKLVGTHVVRGNSSVLFGGDSVPTMAEQGQIKLVGGIAADGRRYIELVNKKLGGTYELHVVDQGDTTQGPVVSVVFLDGALLPKWTNGIKGRLHTWIAMLLGAAGGIMALSLGVSAVLMFVASNSKKDDKGDEENGGNRFAGNDDRQPLLGSSRQQPRASRRSSNSNPSNGSNPSSRRSSRRESPSLGDDEPRDVVAPSDAGSPSDMGIVLFTDDSDLEYTHQRAERGYGTWDPVSACYRPAKQLPEASPSEPVPILSANRDVRRYYDLPPVV